jgi:hypothetical protein
MCWCHPHPAGGVGLLCPGSPALCGSVLDYIPRAEHLRLLEGRLAAKEADLQLELGSRVAQASTGGACYGLAPQQRSCCCGACSHARGYCRKVLQLA